MEESNPELESFRRQWQAEVSARSKETQSATVSTSTSAKHSHKPSPSTHIPIPRHRSTKAPISSRREEEDHDYHVHTPSFDGTVTSGGTGAAAGPSSEEPGNTSNKEPTSALEHYEKAVEKEASGSLGDSLSLYRKAFRMDHRVDQLYKNKHFPHTASSSTKHASKTSISGTAAVPQAPASTSENLTVTQLIHSFSSLKIEPVIPPVEGTPVPPSPLATLPHEILVHILEETAILDIASFARVAQVCKRLAYLVLTEERIWKRICLGSEIGFGAMRYRYSLEIDGTPVVDIAEESDSSDDDDVKGESKVFVSPYGNTSLLATIQLSPSPYPSYHSMLRHRPRIRFPGVYISTVNYIRPGQAAASQLTWNNPLHIVTYYRYLRFFRDGSCLSLLTTVEPADVVYHMTMENYQLHRNAAGHRAERDRDRERDRVGIDGKGPNAHLPSAVMANAFRGRWKLSGGMDNAVLALQQATVPPPSSKTVAAASTADTDSDNETDPEGDIIIETEGIGKYIYVMHLSLLSSPLHPPHHITKSGKRNNKLTWKGFWSYNRLTDDFGEFTLRNDKSFFWSRVGAFAGA